MLRRGVPHRQNTCLGRMSRANNTVLNFVRITDVSVLPSSADYGFGPHSPRGNSSRRTDGDDICGGQGVVMAVDGMGRKVVQL